ncbi:DUF4349 domain-containing protein [Cryobacterium arcticum]|uniref:DUF4349 domain-containing protein n=1 Tax=Cryobacterium arcticum TaxID=670052 RepID=A0A317ZPJ4_9MICO|nr:DUF4349 domain-containing protein [Cryobacterium arcticum]PXA68411.1 DUF4349 domain-containing protein [Cryobacterium arcticum]
MNHSAPPASRSAGAAPMRRRRAPLAALAAGIALAALLLAGCTASSDSAGSTAESGDAGSRSNEMVAPGDAAPQDASAGSTAADRAVITTGSVSLTVTDPIKTAEDAATIVEQAGGRVDSRTENPETDNQAASANLSLRIPAGDLDRTLDELRALGTVNYVSLSAADVTQQSQDVDARITALTTSVNRLLTLMDQATSTTDLIAIEGELSTRQSELESMQSQRDYLTDQIEYSTIGLDLYSTGTVAPGAPDNFWTGIVSGWNALVTTLGALLVGVGFALPWLAILAVAGGIVFLIVRLTTRKGKAT